ncbi:cystine ABC transporter substrate-binding protein, partial [Pseudomonas aeruginosa]
LTGAGSITTPPGRFAKLSEKWFGLDVSQPPK